MNTTQTEWRDLMIPVDAKCSIGNDNRVKAHDMETKFTPGPWEVVESWLGELNVVARKRDRCFGIALNVGGEITFTEKGYTDKSEGIANAHLIAAAPDMYRLLDALCKMDEAQVFVKEPWEQAFGYARELLKKVRGK